jgi:hypothetical protein
MWYEREESKSLTGFILFQAMAYTAASLWPTFLDSLK